MARTSGRRRAIAALLAMAAFASHADTLIADHYTVDCSDPMTFLDGQSVVWRTAALAYANGASQPHSSWDFDSAFSFSGIHGYRIAGYSIEYRGSYALTGFVDDEARLRASPDVDQVFAGQGDYSIVRHVAGPSLDEVFGSLSAMATLEGGDGSTGEPGEVSLSLDSVVITPETTATPVPEPATFAMVLLGLVGLTVRTAAKRHRGPSVESATRQTTP